MRDSKRFIIGIMILFGIIYFASSAFAVPAEKGDFVILGRSEQGELVAGGMVDLYRQPNDQDVAFLGIKSGTTVLVAETTEIKGEKFYLVSTVGREGGLMGWVSEDYIYEITTEPVE